MQGETTLPDGFREQWQRLTDTVSSARAVGSVSREIDSMEMLYAMELQELHSAEVQLCALANKLMTTIANAPLAFRVQEYATELQSR